MQSQSSELSNNIFHPNGWMDGEEPPHASQFSLNSENCKSCHGQTLKGGKAEVSCLSCHHEEAVNPWQHGSSHTEPTKCDGCHGDNFTGSTSNISCISCHSGFSNFSCINCHDGSSKSHPIHNIANARGPSPLACNDCHDVNNYPNFSDGKNLTNTTVCNTCHSPDGAFDGVNDTDIGAKNNWSNGVYTGNTLKTDKKKWCVGCHDNGTSNCSNVNAPDIAGDNNNYGYYINGHGNTFSGNEMLCTDCHDTSFTHIDDIARTYSFSGIYSDNGASYQSGYRLNWINSQYPMKIPALVRTDNDDYRLCGSCHDLDNLLINSVSVTRFQTSGDNKPYSAFPVESNAHRYHIVSSSSIRWDSDWDNTTTGTGPDSVGCDSQTSCITCHNVHGAEGYYGSANESMIRDGRLINRTGARFSYNLC